MRTSARRARNAIRAGRLIRSTIGAAVVMALACAVSPSSAHAQWPQFGGPNRDFSCKSSGLATQWPKDGPPKLWQRKLGDGYSQICAVGEKLFTMYRSGDSEVVICANVDTGATEWEHRYVAALHRGLSRHYGTGPRSTPLVTDDHVFTVGIGAIMYCLRRGTGKVVWSHDLTKEFGATSLRWGYCSSPLAFGDTVIVPVGGKGHAVMAFRQKDGAVAWASGDDANGYSSPLLIDVDGSKHLVQFMADGVGGWSPDKGEPLWHATHETSFDVNASLPVWDNHGTLFVSSAYNTGSRAFKLRKEASRTVVDEMWHQKKMQVHFGDVIRIGDHVYGSTGGNGPTFFAAVNLKTGDVAFRERNIIAKAQLIRADGKIIMLGEDGELAIATCTPKGVTVHARTQLLTPKSWTAPTLVGTKLYVRDRNYMMALDLGRGSN